MIISIIENIVSQINLNGEVFSFGHGQEFFSNIQNDEETLPCIYLDQPINANYELTQSGHIGETYQGLRIYFMYKSELDYLPADHDTNCIIPANNVLRNFISLCQTSTDIKSISNATSLEFINLLNVNVSGILLTIDIEVNIDKSVCVNVVNPVCSPVAVTDTDLIVYSVPAGESFVCTPAVCSPVTVNVNSILFSSVASGGLLDVLVQYEDTTPVGTIVGGIVQIPNPVVCEDAFYFIKNTNIIPTILYSGSIASGGTLNQVIQNSTFNLKKSDLSLINSFSLKAESTTNYDVADSNVQNSNATYNVNVKATESLILPDVTHTDSDGSPTILPAQVPMICSAGVTPSGIAYQYPAPTGQTTSYQVGDDAWHFANTPRPAQPTNPLYIATLDINATYPFHTLVNNNAFGNKSKLTSINGGYYDFVAGTYKDVNGTPTTYATEFTNEIIVNNLNGIAYVNLAINFRTWSDAITDIHGISIYGFNDWRMINLKEFMTIVDYEINGLMYYPPFSNIIFDNQQSTWTSTTRPVATTNAMYPPGLNNSTIVGFSKTNTRIPWYCRYWFT